MDRALMSTAGEYSSNSTRSSVLGDALPDARGAFVDITATHMVQHGCES